MDTVRNDSDLPDLVVLQWSHDLSVMDTGDRLMHVYNLQIGLQWSHDLSVMDTDPSGFLLKTGMSMLQWSHDLSVMDTNQDCTGRLNGLTLQWSHDLSVMDTGVCPGDDELRRNPLQWSHDLSVMDTRVLAAMAHVLDGLQWSHDLSVMDTCLPTEHIQQQRQRFNGATTFQSWIPDSICIHIAVVRNASMEPRPFSHGYGRNSRFSAQVLPFAPAISGFDVHPVFRLLILYLQYVPPSPKLCER